MEISFGPQDKELGISEATQTPQEFQFLTDHVVHASTSLVFG